MNDLRQAFIDSVEQLAPRTDLHRALTTLAKTKRDVERIVDARDDSSFEAADDAFTNARDDAKQMIRLYMLSHHGISPALLDEVIGELV